jgi:hypothetical protein
MLTENYYRELLVAFYTEIMISSTLIPEIKVNFVAIAWVSGHGQHVFMVLVLR